MSQLVITIIYSEYRVTLQHICMSDDSHNSQGGAALCGRRVSEPLQSDIRHQTAQRKLQITV